MDIESISGAATVALTSTLVFVVVVKSWQLLSRAVGATPAFPESIMREAAQRFRDEFERLSASQSTYLSAALVFAVLFAAAYALNAERIFIGYPHWQLNVLLGVLTIAAALVAYRLVCIVLERRQVKVLRDANIAIGHQVQRIASGIGRAYHDVETSAGVIDHVIVGASGVYAVNVVARTPSRKGSVELEGNDLVFNPSGKTASIVDNGTRIASLEREFRRLLDHRVRVRSVIAVPGWEIEGQSTEENLLANERNLPMIRGWRDKADYLMNEDVDALHEMLTRRCRRMPDND